jgi:hypothetical protein
MDTSPSTQMAPNVAAFLFKHTQHLAMPSAENFIRQMQASLKTSAPGVDLSDPPRRSAQRSDLLTDPTWYSRQFANRSPLDVISEESDEDLRPLNQIPSAQSSSEVNTSRFAYSRQSKHHRISKSNTTCKHRPIKPEILPYNAKRVKLLANRPYQIIKWQQSITGVYGDGRIVPSTPKPCIWPTTPLGRAWQQRKDLMMEVRLAGGYPKADLRRTLWRTKDLVVGALLHHHHSESVSEEEDDDDWPERKALSDYDSESVPEEDEEDLDEEMEDREEAEDMAELDESWERVYCIARKWTGCTKLSDS